MLMNDHPQRFVISVLIADRPGILRDITSTVADLHANIDGIRQTVVAGYFTVMLTATLPEACAPETLQARIIKSLPLEGASVTVVPYETQNIRSSADVERYIVTVNGEDHTGILKALTTFFADRNINIEDWNVAFSGTYITHVGQVSVPKPVDVKQVQLEFRQLLHTLKLHGSIQHEYIFRAISEIGPIRNLLSST